MGRGNRKRKSRGKTGVWRKRTGFAFLFCICACWITFDSLFAPFAPMGERVEIPDYCGKEESQLSFAGWMRVTTEYRHDGTTPAGVVIAQIPAGGSLRKLSQKHPTCELKLVVSLGEEFAHLPNVIGADEREATARLREMGFSVFVQRTAGAYPTGEVLEMEPAAGTTLPLGSKVILTVSEGLPAVSVTVPELRGLTRADALMRIWTAQLALGEVVEVPSLDGTGTVLRQSHLPGTTVPAGTKITIYVSSAWEDEGSSSESPYR